MLSKNCCKGPSCVDVDDEIEDDFTVGANGRIVKA